MSLGTDKRYNMPESRVLFYSRVFCFVIVDFPITAFLHMYCEYMSEGVVAKDAKMRGW
jgi:hypothetical protein